MGALGPCEARAIAPLHLRAHSTQVVPAAVAAAVPTRRHTPTSGRHTRPLRRGSAPRIHGALPLSSISAHMSLFFKKPF